MDWLFNSPPSIWQWIGIFVGFIALILAMVTIPHLIWGKPKITVDWDIAEIDVGKALECKIWNEPLTNKVINWFTRRDPVEDLNAKLDICEAGSGKVLVSCIPKIKDFSGAYAQRVRLSSSLIPACFSIAVVDKNDNQVYVRNGRDTDKQNLAPGKYTAKVELLIDGIKPKKVQRDFIVKKDYPFARWKDL